MLARLTRTKIVGVLMALAVAAVMLAFTGGAMAADKVTLKDGRVVEGKITREGDEFVYIVVKVGSIEKQEFFTKDQISKIDRDSGVTDPKAAAAPADTKPSEPAAGKSGATRVCVLNFGPPSSWMGKVGNMVGVQIAAQAWDEVIPMLKKAKVDVVVVRVNSGGGLAAEVPKFHDLFIKKYRPNFRTVGWIESAISAAAMSPYVLEEMYFMPEGNLGACTMFSGSLVAAKGVSLEWVLSLMEKASADAGRDPKIMRSMQIMDPLSVTKDENGEVRWFQDTSGKKVLNPPGQILTINSVDAEAFKFSRGTAATIDELMKKMGINEYEIVAEDATRYVDEFMRRSDATEKQFTERLVKYGDAVGVARAIQDRTQRGAEVGRARRLLDEIESDVKKNANFEFMNPVGELSREWFMLQREMLKELMR
jgi:polyhydroxyalkanoate synthesis regulator phasin/ABC-type amino acid transport substrate-binding protein